jgi:hypothetical protein
MRPTNCLGASFIVIVGASVNLFGLESDGKPVGGPLSGSTVLNAPFSAEAITTVKARLWDGTHIDQTTTMRFYRDRAGRVRVEHLMEGLPSPRTASERAIRTIVDPDPDDNWVYMLDPGTRTARGMGRSIMALMTGGGNSFAVPIGGNRFIDFRRALDEPLGELIGVAATTESLGSRRIEGVATTGRRGTIDVGNIRLEDERWESPELRLVIRARSSDSRAGVIEYALKKIETSEPRAELFELPPDVTRVTMAPVNDPWFSIGPP